MILHQMEHLLTVAENRTVNIAIRFSIKGKFALTSDETSTLEGSSVSYTHPEWTGSFVDVPGLGYMYSVDEDDEGVDLEMIKTGLLR